ncbi:acyl-CoA thioesterase [Anaeromyxobacter oryzisoli]|jgi:4-hydroxybenzoyl-CoA thioesterase|uniref:acyl-CoA thioesterase n=1 Tax=Anaeromyxobacter oryzisoli TaxID=2925408 RepID=UPI001F57CB32|nr:thioesterase family protein [Anaeromyxobacter sp. SG63]
MAFRIQQPVRHPDVDRTGIVYFPRFYDFFHRALEDFFAREVGVPIWELSEKLGVAFPVVHIETDFVEPLQHGDLVTIQVGVTKVTAHAITLAYEVYRPGERDPAARSTVVLACIEVPGWKKTEIPEKVRAAFERHR